MIRSLLVASALLLGVPGCGSGAPAGDNAALGGAAPVASKRLVGARLVEVPGDPPVEWRFTESDFSVACPGGLPPDIAVPLGAAKGTVRVQGKWSLADGSEELVLSDATSSGPAAAPRAVFFLRGAGAVRCDLGERQYNVHEAK